MTKATDFTSEEWTQIFYAPMNAAILVVAADKSKSGLFNELATANAVLVNPQVSEEKLTKLREESSVSAMKDTMMASPDVRDELVPELKGETNVKKVEQVPADYTYADLEPDETYDGPELMQYLVAEAQHQILLHGLIGSDNDDKVKKEEDFVRELNKIHEMVTLVRAKATPEEAEAYTAWITRAAEATARGAKEGSFFGKKVLVSDKEKAMLERIQQAINA